MSECYTDSIELARTLPHAQYDRAQLILAAGRRGFGKTFFVREYCKRTEPRVLYLDPFDDFGPVKEVERDVVFDHFEDYPVVRRRVSPPIGEGSREWANEFFAECVGRLANSLLVLDEITLWSGASTQGSPLETLILQGRRFGIRLVVCCQRISLVPGVILSESTDLVLFRLRRPRDIVVVEDWSDKETASAVKHLGVGECIHVET